MRALLCAMSLAAATCGVAQAQDSNVFWISMRSYANGASQSFVSAATTTSGQQTVSFQACDGNTYYLAQSDYNSVESALAAQNTVQLTTGTQGSDPTQSSIICLIQAGQ